MTTVNELFRLLAAGARIEARPEHLALLVERAAGVNTWERLAALAEEQRMAPLFYIHSRNADLPLPPPVKAQLQGLYLRHRHANQVRSQVLRELLSACDGAGIQVALLKGAALFQWLYPEPGLRPMRDIDLLVRPAEAAQVQALLGRLGFTAPLHSSHWTASEKHLPPATLNTGGITVTIEVHAQLLDNIWAGNLPDTETLLRRARLIPFMDRTACILALEDMLWHIHRHMITEQMRLIAVADLVSLAERFMDEIDWGRLRQDAPSVLEGFSLLHFLTPLSPRLIERNHLEIGDEPQGTGVDFNGWPRLPAGRWREEGLLHLVKETLIPSEWWLRLYYGAGSARPVAFLRYARHPLEVLVWAWQHLRARWRRRVLGRD